MIIREMTAKDIPYVLQIERESFTDPWSENMFNELFSSTAFKSFVAVENDEILGYTSVISAFFVFEIMNIAVKPQSRGIGIATALMEKVVDFAKTVEAESILLEVRRSNLTAQKLYEKFGFIYDGVRRGYYTDGEDALLMSLKM